MQTSLQSSYACEAAALAHAADVRLRSAKSMWEAQQKSRCVQSCPVHAYHMLCSLIRHLHSSLVSNRGARQYAGLEGLKRRGGVALHAIPVAPALAGRTA